MEVRQLEHHHHNSSSRCRCSRCRCSRCRPHPANSLVKGAGTHPCQLEWASKQTLSLPS